MSVIFPLSNLSATNALAKNLAPTLRARDVVTLQGGLGAGKTTFVRALLKELGISEEVPSPTFTLVQTYETEKFPVYHFDLYRLKRPEEIEELGFDDACADGLVLIEWPERAAGFMPRSRLELSFANDDETRKVTLTPLGTWQDRLKG